MTNSMRLRTIVTLELATGGGLLLYWLLFFTVGLAPAHPPRVYSVVRRFPRSSAMELSTARAYAYGGPLIQDLGYYPFGSKFFSNLMH